MNRLARKTAIITGAGSGIGRSIARRFASEGAEVAVLDIDADAGEAAAEEIAESGGTARFFRADVSDQASISEALDAAAAAFGPIDIAVNNAGVAQIGTVETTSEGDFDRVCAVNMKGVFLCLKAEVERMKDRGGVILNMSSVAAFIALPDRFAYSATKGAVNMMTLSVACDFLEHGIRCNAIAPARVHTPFVDGFLAANYAGREEEIFRKLSASQPIGRMAAPDEVAALAAYLCSDEAAFITGAIVPIDGGLLNLRP